MHDLHVAQHVGLSAGVCDRSGHGVHQAVACRQRARGQRRSRLRQRIAVVGLLRVIRLHGDRDARLRDFQFARNVADLIVLCLRVLFQLVTGDCVRALARKRLAAFNRDALQAFFAYERTLRDRVAVLRQRAAIVGLAVAVRCQLDCYRRYCQRAVNSRNILEFCGLVMTFSIEELISFVDRVCAASGIRLAACSCRFICKSFRQAGYGYFTVLQCGAVINTAVARCGKRYQVIVILRFVVAFTVIQIQVDISVASAVLGRIAINRIIAADCAQICGLAVF